MGVYISGIGHYVPKDSCSNDELIQRFNLDSSDEWIYSHTGIKNRHISSEEEATSDLALLASQKALKEANISPSEIDIIIVATTTSDYIGFPSTACVLQAALGIEDCTAFDISVACTGFVYALEVANKMVANTNKKALVVGAETLTKIVDWSDRSTCILFGDGAGAVVLENDEERDSNIIDSILKADGTGASKLLIPSGGSRSPLKFDGNDKNKIEMDGRAVYNFAVQANQIIINQLLEKNNLSLDEIKYIVPHQANYRIIKSVADRENIPLEKFYINIDKYANTSAGTIPIALSEMYEEKLINQNDLIITVGFGSGLTYGGNLIQW